MDKLIFRIISDINTPDQKEYQIFESGNIKGFGDNAIISNRYHSIMRENKSKIDRIISILDKAERIGYAKDNPEGSIYVQLSETLVNDMISILKGE